MKVIEIAQGPTLLVDEFGNHAGNIATVDMHDGGFDVTFGSASYQNYLAFSERDLAQMSEFVRQVNMWLVENTK
mgnify:CR=1 FL=1